MSRDGWRGLPRGKTDGGLIRGKCGGGNGRRRSLPSDYAGRERPARSNVRRQAGWLVTVGSRPNPPVPVVMEVLPVLVVMVVTILVVQVLPRLAAPHADPAHQREPDHPHPGRAGQPGA